MTSATDWGSPPNLSRVAEEALIHCNQNHQEHFMKKIVQMFLVVAAFALLMAATPAFSQGTAFSYAGQLQNNGSPANGTYTMTFTLFASDANGVAVAGPVTNGMVGVTNGLFTVLIDFGPGAFASQANWLQIGVAASGVSTFTTLNPRQQLTPTPYAIYAETSSNVSSSGNFSAGTVTITGDLNLPSMSVSPDIIYSGSALLLYGASDGNFFTGSNAGNLTMTGTNNTANGALSLYYNTSGSFNTAIGFAALQHNLTGSDNTAIGRDALYDNTSGSKNTASGLEALGNNTSGLNNTADGVGALYSNTTGSNNTAAGLGALALNDSGSDNTANGLQALLYNTIGSYDTAMGFDALFNNVIGSNNTAVGYGALYSNEASSDNTGIGYAALYNNVSGTNNTAIGSYALWNSTDDNALVAIGYGALANDDALGGDTTDGNGHNTAIGFEALQLDTSGNANTAIGYNTLSQNTTGQGNTASGDRVLLSNTSGSTNTANGVDSLLLNTSGNYNTAVGYAGLQDNTIGSENTAIGVGALMDSTDGSENTANGVGALNTLASGSYNTADGAWALQYLTAGENNIALGYAAGYMITSGDDNIEIGNYGDSDDSGVIRIGTTGVQSATYLTGTVYADGVELTSDRNAKENFTAVNPREVLARVASLPVTEWNYKTDKKDVQHIGPMAQDFHAAFQLNADEKHISVVDEGGVALAAIQGLNQKVDERDQSLRQELNEKNAEIQDLKARLDKLEQLVAQKYAGGK
jgi:hypothetical protein